MRRRPFAAATVLGLAALLALAGCAPASAGFPGALMRTPDAATPAIPRSEPAIAAADGAIEIGEGPIEIDMWVDFFCPFCRMFDEANGDYLESLVDSGRATLRIHPIAFLDRLSLGTKYSSRAAGAFACVAEAAPSDALAYFRGLFRVQPPEQTEGLPNEILAGIGPAAASDCIRGEWFTGWVGTWTRRSIDAGVTGTPTVFVDGRPFPGGFDPRVFRAFVEPPSSVA